MSLSWETISPSIPASSGDTDAVLRASMAGCAALETLLRSALDAQEPVLLIVNDPQRATQTRPALTALGTHIHELIRGGTLLRAPTFHALVATGTHRFRPEERETFERATLAVCGLNVESIEWHNAEDAGGLSAIGGLRMNRRVAESRFLLAIGSVEPHYFAGVTGPHKTVTIGCLAREAIERNHAKALSEASGAFRLLGNPVYDEVAAMVEALRSRERVICAIGEVVGQGMVLAAAAGDPIDVVEQLVGRVRQTYLNTVDQPFDLLHLRVPDPLGRSLYQADKALKNNHTTVRDGGGILLEAGCVEGVGPRAFLDLLTRANGHAAAIQMIADEGYRLGDHKAVKLLHLMDPACRNVRVALVTKHVAPGELAGSGLSVHRSVESAQAWVEGVIGPPLERGLMIEDAGMVCATLRGTYEPP